MSTTKLATPRALAHWRQVCRSHIRTPNIKRAEIGGGGDSAPFEQALSNLAHAYLKDRAPQLLDHELGFQLLEKNEDNDRAVGIFGFKVGQQLLYAPVFFLNGELKGHELLYLKDSDTFVPMKENWINYVLNRKPNIIGDEIMPQLNRIGVDRPSMDPFRLSPSRTHKYGFAMEPWLADGLPGLMAALGKVERTPLQVPALMKTSAAMATRFLTLLDAYPALAKPIVECYGADMVRDAIKTAQTAESALPIEIAPRTRKIIRGSAFKEADSKLQIWVYDGTANCREGLNDKQAQALQRDGYYIKDAREESAKAYREAKDVTMQNPDETGHYEVLCKPDTFEKCLYIHSPFNARGNRPTGVLIRIGDGDKAWTETHPANIFVNEKYSTKEYGEWFNGLPTAGSLDKGATYVLLAPNGMGTCVFEVVKSTPAAEGENCYEVHWRNRYSAKRPDYLPPVGERGYSRDNDYCGPDQISLGEIKGSRFLVRAGIMYAPPGTRALKIKDVPKPKKDDTEATSGSCSPCCGDDSSEPAALRPGDLVDLQIGLYKTAAVVKIFNNGTEAQLAGRRMSPRAALISLVRDYGLREKTAKTLLTEAQAKRGVRCHIKVADTYGTPYGALGSPPSAPPFPPEEVGTDSLMGSGLPTSFQQEQEIPVESMRSLPARPNYADPPDPMMSQQIQQAAQVGQKEVLDTSLLSNLLRGSQNETIIDRHLPALMKGLDSLGRLLFNLYWHHDKFEDRYGGSVLPELEDNMRNAFENLGDVTFELKKKSIEPFPDEGGEMPFGGGNDT